MIYNVYHDRMEAAVFSSYDRHKANAACDRWNAPFKAKKLKAPYSVRGELGSSVFEKELQRCASRYP